jgi:hypothetical protein
MKIGSTQGADHMRDDPEPNASESQWGSPTITKTMVGRRRLPGPRTNPVSDPLQGPAYEGSAAREQPIG